MSFCEFSSLCCLVDFRPGLFWFLGMDPCSLELLLVDLGGWDQKGGKRKWTRGGKDQKESES